MDRIERPMLRHGSVISTRCQQHALSAGVLLITGLNVDLRLHGGTASRLMSNDACSCSQNSPGVYACRLSVHCIAVAKWTRRQ